MPQPLIATTTTCQHSAGLAAQPEAQAALSTAAANQHDKECVYQRALDPRHARTNTKHR